MGINALKLEDILCMLRKHKPEFESAYGVTDIGVFGSVARGDAKAVSDVDIVVKMKHPDLFFMVHIKELIENECKTHVDIIHYRNRMNPLLKKRIDHEVVYV